ncbi:MAG: dephospho-CoA kinase [Sphaerochaetaceae bacterium]|nr:dephospho-CoA kinase [Spirochaetales bacterium]MDY5499499.1 dephospho-CoA kinase [Sphaerochaetaceae bacterium]
MLVVGLTGRACSGKNVVADLLVQETGWTSIDFDKLGWPVLEESHEELKALFGPGCVTPEGTVDHRMIREAVYRDPVLRGKLESITHPKIVAMCHQLTQQARQRGERAIIWNAPLLQRVHLDEECDAVVFVDASPEVRFSRAEKRDGMDRAQFEARERNQSDVDPRTVSPKARLFMIVNNGGDDLSLHRQVVECCAKIAEIRKDGQ